MSTRAGTSASSEGRARESLQHGTRVGSKGGKLGRPPKESMHERSARLQKEQGLREEAKPGQPLTFVNPGGGTWDRDVVPGMVAEARAVQHLYGDHQLGAVLSGYAPDSIRELAANVNQELSAHIPARASKAERISQITSALTGGKYSANFPKASAKSGAGAPKGRSVAAASRRAPAAAAAPRKELVPVHTPAEIASRFGAFDRDRAASAYELAYIYGGGQLRGGQLRDALDGYTLATLKGMAQEVMGRNPGTKPTSVRSKAALVDYLTRYVRGE